MKEEDTAKIQSGIQNLSEAAMKLGQVLYESQAENAEESTAQPEENSEDDIEVVDAEYDDVEEDNQK